MSHTEPAPQFTRDTQYDINAVTYYHVGGELFGPIERTVEHEGDITDEVDGFTPDEADALITQEQGSIVEVPPLTLPRTVWVAANVFVGGMTVDTMISQHGTFPEKLQQGVSGFAALVLFNGMLIALDKNKRDYNRTRTARFDKQNARHQKRIDLIQAFTVKTEAEIEEVTSESAESTEVQ